MGDTEGWWVVRGEVPGINTPTAEQGATGHLRIDYHSFKSYLSILGSRFLSSLPFVETFKNRNREIKKKRNLTSQCVLRDFLLRMKSSLSIIEPQILSIDCWNFLSAISLSNWRVNFLGSLFFCLKKHCSSFFLFINAV